MLSFRVVLVKNIQDNGRLKKMEWLQLLFSGSETAVYGQDAVSLYLAYAAAACVLVPAAILLGGSVAALFVRGSD